MIYKINAEGLKLGQPFSLLGEEHEKNVKSFRQFNSCGSSFHTGVL